MKNKKGVLALICTLFVIGIVTWTAFLGVGDSDLIGIRNIHLGLDLAGGVSITYQAQGEDTVSAEQMEGALAIINNRLSSQGYTEAQAFIESGNRIRVEIPGVSDANEAGEQIGRTAMLTFVLSHIFPTSVRSPLATLPETSVKKKRKKLHRHRLCVLRSGECAFLRDDYRRLRERNYAFRSFTHFDYLHI